MMNHAQCVVPSNHQFPLLFRVAMNEEHNQMNPQNLAIVFGPTILRLERLVRSGYNYAKNNSMVDLTEDFCRDRFIFCCILVRILLHHSRLWSICHIKPESLHYLSSILK